MTNELNDVLNTDRTNTNDDLASRLKRATGLSLTDEQLTELKKSMSESSNAHTISTPDAILTDPTMLKEYEDAKVVKLDEEVAFQEANQKIDERIAKNENMITDMLNAALSSEDARLEQLESDPESDPMFRYEIEKKKRGGDVVTANREELAEDELQKTTSSDDFMPSYGADDDEIKSDKETKMDETNAEEEVEDEQTKYIRGLVNADTEPEGESAIEVKREQVITIKSNRDKSGKVVGDQAFLNAINKFKKDNFRVVTVPMVNSGFMLDVVGSGAVDITMLYMGVDENTSIIDYELEKMKTIIKNVVGTSPRIDPMQLKNMIHYNDYQMMAYGHICATLNEIASVHTCTGCGKDFRITANPNELILNLDELKDKIDMIRNAKSIADISLLAINKKITTEDGYEVVIGHPSYIDMINLFTAVKSYTSKLSQSEALRFNRMTQLISMIRSFKLPNGLRANNAYQIYYGLNLLSDESYKLVTNEIVDFAKKAIIPKFGIKRVKCPHCGKINTDIPFDKLDDMIFFHTTVTRTLK